MEEELFLVVHSTKDQLWVFYSLWFTHNAKFIEDLLPQAAAYHIK